MKALNPNILNTKQILNANDRNSKQEKNRQDHPDTMQAPYHTSSYGAGSYGAGMINMIVKRKEIATGKALAMTQKGNVWRIYIFNFVICLELRV